MKDQSTKELLKVLSKQTVAQQKIWLKRQISYKEERIRDVENDSRLLHDDLYQYLARYAELNWMVKEGVEVIIGKKRYKITKVMARDLEKPWCKGVQLKANGKYGTAVRHLYSDWQLYIAPGKEAAK